MARLLGACYYTLQGIPLDFKPQGPSASLGHTWEAPGTAEPMFRWGCCWAFREVRHQKNMV